jgi:hypothetical protein
MAEICGFVIQVTELLTPLPHCKDIGKGGHIMAEICGFVTQVDTTGHDL